MKSAATPVQPQPKFRKDYAAPDFRISTTDLEFELAEETIVRAKLSIDRSDSAAKDAPLVLDGEELTTRRVAIDGRVLGPAEYTVSESDESLTIPNVPDSFVLETEISIRPFENTALSGLYGSSGNFCTQCEAEGFRRITWYLDRPDVMAVFSTTILADPKRYPVLLSNGNRISEETLDDGRKRVRWEDPYPKPCYLFALVGGDLRRHEGSFKTRSGRDVTLEIWVEPRNIDSCEHALRSLQKSMKWDEDTYGLEYDLDIYMIVAVGDFNMGAMENKGLNIFNSKYVLARPETATDGDYEGVEAVIGHEYFHNWTGNRVTCRDWFQLTLKEGLTVFRDSRFTADMTSAAVKRIGDVKVLRIAQFAEDAGPMAHPVRPESYIEMNNFYTVTVYEKGAEVVGMYQTLFGVEGFRKGMDLYFERHDGQAVTCDDFRSAMADANGVDLSQFERWYQQAGTPTVTARGTYDADASTYTLHLSQRPGKAAGEDVLPLHIPIAVGLLGPDGSDFSLAIDGCRFEDGGRTAILELREKEQAFVFKNVSAAPVPSILRRFSAPVRLEFERERSELAFLVAHDSDEVNRWDAGQTLAQEILLELCQAEFKGKAWTLDPLFVEAWGKVLSDDSLDGSLKALALSLPAERQLGQEQEVVRPDELHAVRREVVRQLSAAHREALEACYQANAPKKPYSSDKDAIDRRRLAGLALSYLCALEEPKYTSWAAQQFRDADNMTDSQTALSILANIEAPEREEALGAFYDRWKEDPLVLDKWFSVQAQSNLPDANQRMRELEKHPDFTLQNPNRARSLVGVFAMGNQVRFHQADGSGYEFLSSAVIELNKINPQVASRMVSGFNSWRRFDEKRQGLMRAQLERISKTDNLSKDVYEIVTKALG